MNPPTPSDVPALAQALLDGDGEKARAARRALEALIHHAGRPGAADDARAAETALLGQLNHESVVVRRAVLWLLSEIGGDASVEPMAKLLADSAVREDARCALQRIPGKRSLQALKTAMHTLPEDVAFAMAESLRKRGEHIAAYPSKKLTPTRSTQVTAIPAETQP